MKKLFSLALGMMFALSVQAGERSYLQVTFVSGDVGIIYSDWSLIKMGHGYDSQKKSFVLTINDDTYDFFGMKELRFVSDAQSIEQPEAVQENLSFHLYDRRVVISGRNLSGIGVYTIDGKAVPAAIERSEDAVTVDFSSCAPGIYIVKTNINSIKVSIR